MNKLVCDIQDFTYDQVVCDLKNKTQTIVNVENLSTYLLQTCKDKGINEIELSGGNLKQKIGYEVCGQEKMEYGTSDIKIIIN